MFLGEYVCRGGKDEVNILFMIGNGFDLNVGLKTSFHHFLPVYLRLPSSDARIEKFKETIDDEGIQTWANFEARLGEYAKEFNPDKGDDLVYCKDNFLEEFVNYLIHEESKIDYADHADEILRVFKKSLSEYIATLPSASSNAIKAVYAKYANERHYYDFMSYNYTGVLDACINILKSQQTAVFQHRANNGNTITDRLNNVLHIHGTIDADTILGCDNASQIHNDVLSCDNYFTRLLLKPSINERLRNQNHEKGEHLIDTSSIICVFGMSIGITDKTWWKKIGNWLLQGEPHNLVLFDIEDYRRIHTSALIRARDRITNRFFEMADFPEDKCEAYEPKIHIGLNTDVFKIDLTKSTKKA